MHWRQFQQQQKVVDVGDRFVSYVDVGRGPAVVLVHGLPTWGYVWHRVIPALEKSRRVLIPDLPGCGFSDKSDRFDRSISRQAERLAAWMHELGVASADVVGHEAGAAVALRLAALQPTRVQKLCLLGALAYDAAPIDALVQLGRPGADRKFTANSAARVLREALRPGFVSPDDELIEGLLAPYATEAGKLSLIRAAGALDASQFFEVLPKLPELAAETLVMWGASDAFQPLSSGKRLAWELPRAGLSVVEDAGHFAMLDRPGEVSARLQDFLALGLVRTRAAGRPVEAAR